MTVPSFGDILVCLVQVSVVAGAVLCIRSCVARRFAASRAVIGAVGMACVLVVSGVIVLPPVRFSSWPDTTTVPTAGVSNWSRGDASRGIAASPRAGRESISTENSSTGIAVPTSWLRRLRDGLSDSIVRAGAAPGGWQVALIVFVAAGIGVGAVRLACALCGVRRLYRSSTAIGDERLIAAAARIASRCRCRWPIELRETDELASAATFGIRRHVILLPVDWQRWSQDELAAVLAHEVAHIRRRDFLQRLIGQLAAVVHFYHPLVRACARRLAIDQEFAADRLASTLDSGPHDYVRGLAKLALRFDNSFSDNRWWSSVSITPRSSDFLARRLDMLRRKNHPSSNRTVSTVSACASISVVLVALAATLLRGATSDENASEPTEATPHAATKVAGEKIPAPNPPSGALFGRAPFDVSIIPHAENGAMLIRFGDILRLPEAQSRVEVLNRAASECLESFVGKESASIDLRQIEWIAGALQAKVKPFSGKDAKHALVLGADPIVVRMAHAGNWQEIILKNVAGATRKSFEGQSYVQLAPIPALGPAGFKLRFPDDRTIVTSGGSLENLANASNKDFFDVHPPTRAYPWTDAWRGVDGGLVTLVYDNRKMGWGQLPKDCQDWPEPIAPLFDKMTYFAAGLDFAESNRCVGVRLRGTSPDRDSVKDLHLASSLLLNECWPELFHVNDVGVVKDHMRVLQLLSSAKIETSRADSNQHFVQAKAEVTLRDEEVLKLLAVICGAP